MEYEKCYVYDGGDARPAKRRRTEPQGLQASWKARRDAYRTAWAARETMIKAALEKSCAWVVNHISEFSDEAANGRKREKIPTAILSAGPETSSYNAVIEQLSRLQNARKHRVMISIAASTGGNLKALLKAIVQKTTAHQGGLDDDDEDITTSRKGVKLLNYDLQLLADYVRERQLEQVAIAVGDTEAFDSDLLSEMIEHLGHWRDRIPFFLILGVATSASSLQQRLCRTAARSLTGQQFDAASSSTQLDDALIALVGDNPAVWLGGDVMSLILERQNDYIQSVDSFSRAARYAYMSHYYPNALSIFLVPDLNFPDVPRDHFEALRNVSSFRQHCKQLLGSNDADRLRDLLGSDQKLFLLVTEQVREIQRHLSEVLPALRLLQDVRRLLDPSSPLISLGKLYTQAMSGRLARDSSLIRSTLLAIRKSHYGPIAQIMGSFDGFGCSKEYLNRSARMYEELVRLVDSSIGDDQPLRSEDDVQNTTLRTTVVAQKVELSKQKATLSKRDQAYTTLLKRFSDLLEEYFGEVFADVKGMLFHELVVYDSRSPYRESFSPRSRHAVERALATPHDYLDCECCAQHGAESGEESTLSASQPATAVMYQLYVESGSLINATDLRQAFHVVMGEVGSSDEENMALFQQALAEMRYLGLVKATRKRVDHVSKVAWRGL